MSSATETNPLLNSDKIGAEINVDFDYLTDPTETGKPFGLSGRTILNLEARGVITAAIRVGRIVRFDLAQIKAQLAAATVESRRIKQEARLATAARTSQQKKSDHNA